MPADIINLFSVQPVTQLTVISSVCNSAYFREFWYCNAPDESWCQACSRYTSSVRSMLIIVSILMFFGSPQNGGTDPAKAVDLKCDGIILILCMNYFTNLWVSEAVPTCVSLVYLVAWRAILIQMDGLLYIYPSKYKCSITPRGAAGLCSLPQSS